MDILELVFLIAAVVALLWYVMIHIPREVRKRYDRKLGSIDKILTILNRVVDNTCIERALILKSHNGDGKPRFGYKLYVSGIYEVCRDPFQYKVDAYQKLIADTPYVEMLLAIKDYKDEAFFVTDMPDGMLRRFYENEGVKWSYIYKIGEDPTGIYYGSFATSQDTTPFRSGQGVSIELAINDMRNIYKKINNTTLKRLRRKFYV